MFKKTSNRDYLLTYKRVQRLMHNMELLGNCLKEKYLLYREKVGKNLDSVININLNPTILLQRWFTNILVILDMNTNEIISYGLSLSLNTEKISLLKE